MSDLPVNIDTLYEDDLSNPSRKLHQQHHDALHAKHNALPPAADVATLDDIDDKVTLHGAAIDTTHGAVAGASKIARIHTPAGTGANIFVDEESSPSTPLFEGDIRIVVDDGFFS